ncbi:histidinol-phosphatase [Carboxylicivirga sp. M1479]|uniref:histidinol-phosphatase n=1 Tax=Carboxylicivirga sp. M1479 TaxID=2594476 RepID=UPI0011776284|nr:histidinol-phosphatase [Carboxylicivirga sp. M1479]TRX71354.1 histidinol-phosphatase [Carboxylicivirga sp. M1479]
MGWTNYHGHCEYCDGAGKIEDYIIKAIELEMDAVGISSHAPVPFPTDWTMPAYKLESYQKEIDALKIKYQDQIKVYKSLEVDYIPGLAAPNHEKINECHLDYTVGSVHYIGKMQDGTHWAVDAPADEFKKGLDYSFDGDGKRAAIRYFELQREMLEDAKPTILGHMDKIKMHNQTFNLFDEQEQWYVDEVIKTLALAKEKGVIVEINTKAFYRDDHLFPGPEHFKKMKELGVAITINSDAHHPDKLTNAFEEVAQMLVDAGYTHLTELIDGQWQEVPFTNVGIGVCVD